MPPLDPKEEAIVAAYISNGGDQTAAWRKTHPNSKASAKTQHEAASRFFRQSKVRTRILELHAEVASKLSDDAALTLEAHMKELREIRDKAKLAMQLSAAARCEQLRGEAMGHYVKRVETGEAGEFARMTTEELRTFVYGNEKPAKSKH